jgi:hypothetical protein
MRGSFLISALILLLIVWGVIYLLSAKPWRRPRIPTFDEEWQRLSGEERRRIDDAARLGELPSDPDEAYLTAGAAVKQLPYWRGRRKADLGILFFALLFIGASIPYGNGITLIIGFFLLATFLVRLRRRRAVLDGLNRTVAAQRLEQDP